MPIILIYDALSVIFVCSWDTLHVFSGETSINFQVKSFMVYTGGLHTVQLLLSHLSVILGQVFFHIQFDTEVV